MTDARSWGVQRQYEQTDGGRRRAPNGTVTALLAALGAGSSGAPPAAGAVFLHRGDRLDEPLEVVTEDGRSMLLEGLVDDSFPFGYHRVAGLGGETALIVSPRRCLPARPPRRSGWALQLYAARSSTSWGIGDLGDLRRFGAWAAATGASFMLVNPLDAVSLSPPIEASPYLPTSRRWRNPLYLRVEDVPGAAALGAELEPLAAAARALNQSRLIDRDTVAALKLDALARIATATRTSRRFAAWRRAQGEALERFATFSVIAELHGGDFRQWPAELRDPASPAVARLRRRESARVRFHAWLQWLLDGQLAGAAEALPLMADLPIGVAPGGADVWADRALFVAGFSAGAPPDSFNLLGQTWSQPPWNPWLLRARGYAPLVELLRSAFAHAHALRIDHVMGLFRLFVVPEGQDPAAGTYLRYPAADLLDVLALESHRAGAIVVGEDLGTVEPVVRREMAARDILSYRLLWFEPGAPDEYPEHALSAVTTHDLPTIAGLWSGADTAALRRIGLPINERGTAEMRRRLARLAGSADPDVTEVVVAAYRALAGSPSLLVAAALEDAAGVSERPNMPGTTGERWPNWRLALPAPLEEVLETQPAGRVAAALRRD